MKKGLSVLLIAAALFGFYGGAVNLNDVLACKEYWEVEGERSTADMNKLEDGLNQLKDNEEAYLDGLDQVADGEEALADGEAELEAGRAELAQGEADYAAAPAKLASARKQLAEGEEALADGKDSIKGLKKLIKGITTITTGYKNTWRPGYEKLKDGRKQLFKGSKGSKGDLQALAVFLKEGSQEGYVAAVEDVAGDDQKQTAKDYKKFIKSTNTMAKALPKIQKKVKETADSANALLKALKAASGSNLKFAGTISSQKSALKKFAEFIPDSGQRKQFLAGIDTVAGVYETLDETIEKYYQAYLAGQTGGKPTVEQLVEANMDTGWTKFFGSDQGKQVLGLAKQGIAQQIWASKTGKAQPTTPEEQQQFAAIVANVPNADAMNLVKTNAKFAEAQAGVKAAVEAEVKAQVKAGVEAEVKKQIESNKELTAGKQALIAAMTAIAEGLDEVNDKVNGDDSAIKNVLLPGLKKFNKAATADKIDELSAGQDDLADGIRTVSSAVLGNSTLKNALRSKMGSKAVTLLKGYRLKPNKLNSKMSDFAAFEKQMDKKPGMASYLAKANGLLKSAKAQGQKDLAAGASKLAAGRKQYAQGLADYKAAPAKLAEGRAKLADGEAQLEEGRETLEEGKEKLAEYEDGEQQVRDGLATLMGTEANGGLDSILDRRNGDDKFDDPNGHLQLDEGLEAVEVGRGYQADSGELITKEITNRAVGTAAGLGAAALAVLAGILSLLKKNKGAGVCAVLTAAAGAAGIAAGTGAGTEFSNIAGSTVGSTPYIAFGILAGVALVHAIAHFAAKSAE